MYLKILVRRDRVLRIGSRNGYKVKEEVTVHPLRRVLPVRKFKTGGRPWVTGEVEKAEKSWYMKNVEWTNWEKRLAVAEMTGIGVMSMMNTHLFQWAGKFYLQRKGGPIGLRATCAVARVTMLFWDEKLMKKMSENNLTSDDGSRYMDDIRLIMNAIQMGWRWMDGGMYFSDKWKEEDMSDDRTATQRTSDIIKGIMNSIMSFLNLTMEIGDDFQDGKLPTLDVKVWVESKSKILIYEYFEKEMKTNMVIQRKSALCENINVNSLSQEVVRVSLNFSELLEIETRVRHLDNVCLRMKTSGYDTPFIRKIMLNGLKSYEGKLKKSRIPEGRKGYSPLHHGKCYNAAKRLEKKMLTKNNWYKGKLVLDDEDEDNTNPEIIKHGRGKGKSKGKKSQRM